MEEDLHLALNEDLISDHRTPIHILSWNPPHDKLLSLDLKGLMIIWTESNGQYVEEMVNESEKKKIKQARWSTNGNMVVIVMDGGSLVLGATDGRRLWGKELSIDISLASFADEDRVVVVSDDKGTITCVDTVLGETFSEVELEESGPHTKLSSKGSDIFQDQPASQNPLPERRASIGNRIIVFEGSKTGSLFIGLKEGSFFIVNNLRVSEVKKFDYGLSELLAGAWNPGGTIFALSTRIDQSNQVLILSPQGDLLKAILLGKPVSHLAFNSKGDRALLATGATLSYLRVNQPQPVAFLPKYELLFVGTENEIFSTDKHHLHLGKQRILFMRADDERILVVSEQKKTNYVLAQIFNRNLAQLSSLKLPFIPSHTAFSCGRVAFAHNGAVLLWDLALSTGGSNAQSAGISSSAPPPKITKKKLLLVRLSDPQKIIDYSLEESSLKEEADNVEDIRCIALGENQIYIITGKGVLRRFNTQSFIENTAFPMKKRPISIFLSYDESHIATLDVHGELCLIDIRNEALVEVGSAIRDVGSFVFARDSLDFALTIKG